MRRGETKAPEADSWLTQASRLSMIPLPEPQWAFRLRAFLVDPRGQVLSGSFVFGPTPGPAASRPPPRDRIPQPDGSVLFQVRLLYCAPQTRECGSGNQ